MIAMTDGWLAFTASLIFGAAHLIGAYRQHRSRP